jgi:outer membrane protein TolC
LDQAREQVFFDQAMQDLTRAQLADEIATAELNRVLAISDETKPALVAEHLPDLPQNIAILPTLEQTAMQNRLDLMVMRAQIDALARSLKLTKATRIVNILEAGPTWARDGTREDPIEKGYTVSLEVPIFDTGDARVRKAEAIYSQAVERFAQAAIDARVEVRVAAARYRSTYVLAVFQRDNIVRLRKAVTKQDLLRHNASLASTFDLLADARAQISSVSDYIQYARDFWIAKSHLDTALIANAPREP